MARQRILVVDDEENLRDVLVEVLKRDGHDVHGASDGTDGLRRIQDQRYDLVITDLRMPGLEGPALYKALRQQYPDDPPRVIFMSANTGIEDYARGLVPLVVPITMLRHYVKRAEIAWLAGQVYLDPHPKELMLRNQV